MSIQSEISRIQSNVQDTINVIQSTGVTVPSGANSDNLPGLAAALANEKQDKLTGTPGQIVGFDSQGNAVAQDVEIGAEDVDVPTDTAALYGLTGDATVDQVLQILKNAAVVNSAGDALETILGSTLLSIPGVQIATGSYVGTGTYGSSNPNSLTFDFAPDFVLIYFYFYSSPSSTIGYSTFLPFSKELTGISVYQYGSFSNSSYTGYTLTGQSWSNNFKTLTWYGLTASNQANVDGYTYHYIAIG